MTTTLNAATAGAGGLISTADASGVLQLQTAGTAALTIDGSQNVTLAGNITLNNGAADGAQLTLSSSGYSDWNLDNYSGRFRAYYGATEYFTINASGNVGIGTASPGAKLSVTTASAGIQATFGVGTGLNYIAVGSGNTSTYQTRFGYDVSSEYGYIQPYAAAGVADDLAICPSGGNVGIGTSSPNFKAHISTGSTSSITQPTAGSYGLYVQQNTSGSTGGIYIQDGASNSGASIFVADNNGVGRFVVDGNGNLLVGTTSTAFTSSKSFIFDTTSANGYQIINHPTGSATGSAYMYFGYGTGSIGSITQNGTTAVAYNTSSDYRLKNTVAPMTGALARVAALKPCTYKWNADDSDGEGFIAHELAEVVPQCVTGEKDAVDANGNPVYQGIDTSFLVATLTAAIQEQQALITQLTERITALEAK